MQRALVALVAVVFLLIVIGCGSSQKKRRRGGKVEKEETAAEYQRRKAREAGELDEEGGGDGASGRKWGGWRYQGERDDCRYLLGRRCFAKRDDACKAARCKSTCKVDGGGPALVTCSKS